MLRALSHTGSEVATMLGTARQIVHAWKKGAKVPSRAYRAALEQRFGIPAAAWERLPVDRSAASGVGPAVHNVTPAPSGPPATGPSSAPSPPTGRPTTTLDEVLRHLADLDADARAEGVMPSELARIRDTKTKTLALKARLEAADSLFEAEAVARHPAWKRARAIILDELRAHPDIARRIAERLAAEAQV